MNINFNLNDKIKIKLTKNGRKYLKKTKTIARDRTSKGI